VRPHDLLGNHGCEAILRLLQRTGTKISQEKYFPDNFHGVQSYDTPRLSARGGSWEERNPKTKVKVMVKVKTKVVWNVHHHHPRTDLLSQVE
jgi:hypothetical protein